MGFPKEIRDQALIACKRHCVLCECEKGVNVECHHIIPRADGGQTPVVLKNDLISFP